MLADKVLIDSNCLHKLYLRTLLLTLSDAELIQPRWSQEILDETIRSINRRFPESSSSVTLRLNSLSRYFQGSLVSDYSYLAGNLGCKDSADEHVLAAAIHGRCEVLLTFNIGDFPNNAFELYGVNVMHPGVYLSKLAQDNESTFLSSCSSWLRNFKMPEFRTYEAVQAMRVAGCPQLAEWLDARAEYLDQLL